jgi:6-pyruvoyltetrahydropterin/6-carboxytetrahydropterin synthase
MPRASLTRRVKFAAAHRYRRPDWTQEQNERVFGLCARESYHGHTYRCDVTLSGEIDPSTGFVFDLGELDRILAAEVTGRFDHRNINTDIPEFAEGRLIPTGENLARFIYETLEAQLPPTLTLADVTVHEDDTLSASYGGNA